MDQFADDDEDADGDKKSRFKNSKRTGDVNKFKRDKNTPAPKSDEKQQQKEEKVFRPLGKVTLGKWDKDEDEDKRIAAERLAQLDAQTPEEDTPKQKAPKFVGKANIGEKTRQFEEDDRERQQLAQEKLKLMEQTMPTTGTKIELVKQEPKDSKFKNSKREGGENKFKKPKVDAEAKPQPTEQRVKESVKQTVKAPAQNIQIAPTVASKW